MWSAGKRLLSNYLTSLFGVCPNRLRTEPKGLVCKNEKKHLFGDCWWGVAFSLTQTSGRVCWSKKHHLLWAFSLSSTLGKEKFPLRCFLLLFFFLLTPDVKCMKNLLSDYLTKNEKKHLFGDCYWGAAFSLTSSLGKEITSSTLLSIAPFLLIDFLTSTWSKGQLSDYLTKNEKKHLFGDCYWGVAFSSTSTSARVVEEKTYLSSLFFFSIISGDDMEEKKW